MRHRELQALYTAHQVQRSQHSSMLPSRACPVWISQHSFLPRHRRHRHRRLLRRCHPFGRLALHHRLTRVNLSLSLARHSAVSIALDGQLNMRSIRTCTAQWLRAASRATHGSRPRCRMGQVSGSLQCTTATMAGSTRTCLAAFRFGSEVRSRIYRIFAAPGTVQSTQSAHLSSTVAASAVAGG